MKKEKEIVLITGASSGIGRACAIRLSKEGYKVFAGVRRKTDKIELEKINKNIIGVYLDVSNSSSIEKAFWYVLKNTEKIDVLINNAGIAIAGPVEFLSIKKIKEQFDVNTFGALAVTQKFMPLLYNSKIINISSMAASGLFPYISAYSASKRAMDILFNSLLLENKDNIKVISIKPASIKTPIWNKSVAAAKENFANANDIIKTKYEKELSFLEKKALENNQKGIEIKAVVNQIYKVIKTENPKSSYTVGFQALFTELLSKFSINLTNKLIKARLKNI